ncbi:phosphohydrolase [Sesbania bispinosa]|nr:phosphohydrolase [Sesbania bispinosa]
MVVVSGSDNSDERCWDVVMAMESIQQQLMVLGGNISGDIHNGNDGCRGY